MKHSIKLSEEIDILIKKHRALDIEAEFLSSRKYLTPPERQKLKALKINRLRVKDKISSFKIIIGPFVVTLCILETPTFPNKTLNAT